VQAVVFSGLTVGAPLGPSQLTFVAGKTIPGETIRRVDQEINAARAAWEAARRSGAP